MWFAVFFNAYQIGLDSGSSVGFRCSSNSIARLGFA